METKLSIELIQLIPEKAVKLYSLGKTLHGEPGLAQGLDKPGSMINCLIQVPIFAIPVALPPPADPDGDI
jgi:hypothetical protein